MMSGDVLMHLFEIIVLVVKPRFIKHGGKLNCLCHRRRHLPHSLLTLRLLWALPGRIMSFLRRPAERLPHSREPWKAQRHDVQNWKLQSALLHTPSPFTEWHLAGCWHRGHGLRHSSLKRVLATWRQNKKKCVWDLHSYTFYSLGSVSVRSIWNKTVKSQLQLLHFFWKAVCCISVLLF